MNRFLGKYKDEGKSIEVFVLQIILIGIVLAYGGFYEFIACVLGIVLAIYCIVGVYKMKKIVLKFNFSAMAVMIFVLGYGVSLLYAIDRGMAAIGFVKFLTLLLFMICVWQIDKNKRIKILQVVPISGSVIVGAGILSLCAAEFKDFFFLSGRFGGTFQYPNTMALYFLIGIVIIQAMELDRKKYLSMVFILYGGILLTGSRTVFIMAVPVMFAVSIIKKEMRMQIWGGMIIFFLVGVGYVLFTSDFQNIGRFFTTELNSSTFLGRLLYWKDGIRIMKEHPWGLGYEGYKYVQGRYQTGVYSVEFVHNDWLQIALDIGVIPVIVLIAAIIQSFISKKRGILEKIVLGLIVFHSFFDFDLQYLAMWFILFLVMDIDGKENQICITENLKKVGLTANLIVLCCIWGYFFFPLYLHYMGKYQTAYEIYPAYTEAKIELLKDCDSLDYAEELADSIIKRNQYVSVAYDAKALLAFYEGDYKNIIENKKLAIYNAPYSKEEYMDYLNLLSNSMEYFSENGKEDEWEKCREAALEIPEMMESIKEKTDTLGMMIRDKPDMELSDEMMSYLEEIKDL